MPKVYSMSFLVGGKCNPKDSGPDYKRHFPEDKTAFKCVNERAISLRIGDKNGLTDFGRVPKLWSSQKIFAFRFSKDKEPCSLVHTFQIGGEKQKLRLITDCRELNMHIET